MLKTAAAGLLTALLISTAPAAAQTASPGLPMWVIRDADSTIYVAGTVHGLPPGLAWRSAKLDAALMEATDVWFEVSEVVGGLTITPELMLSRGPALSSRLNAEERTRLAQVAAQLKVTPAVVAALERMTPGAATLVLVGYMAAASGLSAEDGIDTLLGQAAKAQGDRIHGLESVDDQLRVFITGTEDEQLAAFRQYLFAPEEPSDSAEFIEAVEAYVTRGDTETLADAFGQWAQAVSDQPQGQAAMDRLLLERNARWAPQIEEILAGEGVSFIAVGAGHLVGPDNLFELLRQRGIEAERY